MGNPHFNALDVDPHLGKAFERAAKSSQTMPAQIVLGAQSLGVLKRFIGLGNHVALVSRLRVGDARRAGDEDGHILAVPCGLLRLGKCENT